MLSTDSYLYKVKIWLLNLNTVSIYLSEIENTYIIDYKKDKKWI